MKPVTPLRRGKWRSAAALLAAAAAGVAGLAMPASASTATQWRIANLWGSAAGYFESIATVAPNSAWAVGTLTHGGALAAHWNGRGWQTTQITGSRGYDLMQVAASSASNVWVFGQGLDAVNAFRYDGAHWHTMALPTVSSSLDVQHSRALVFSPTDVWLAIWGSCPTVSGKMSCSSDVWHWNGSAWADHRVGAAITGFAGISDSDLLAVAFTGSQNNGVPGTITADRWNGSRWVGVSIPNSYGEAPSIAMDSASDIWIDFPHASCCAVTAYHSTASGWKTISVVWTNGYPNPVADGHGGVWLGSQTHWTGSDWADLQDNLLQTNISVWQYYQMVKVPGTTGTYWLAGFAIPYSSNTTRPMIAIYGPTP